MIGGRGGVEGKSKKTGRASREEPCISPVARHGATMARTHVEFRVHFLLVYLGSDHGQGVEPLCKPSLRI